MQLRIFWAVVTAVCVCAASAGAASLNPSTSYERGLSVTEFGAIADGSTDNSKALLKAFSFAALNRGTRLHFPCGAGGSTYRVAKPLTIPDGVVLSGDSGDQCGIVYEPLADPGPVDAAFAITGAGHVTIDSLKLETRAAFPPAVILELGRVNGGAGGNKILNTTIRGFATKALVYSQASENNIWLCDTFRFLGGGAHFGFYTSGKDDLGICSGCREASNLSLYLDKFVFVVETDQNPFVAIGDQIGGGTGDHYFNNGYIGLNKDVGSVGLEFISGAKNQGGPNSRVSVRDIRIENGGFGFHFKKNFQPSLFSVTIEGVTWSSSVIAIGVKGAPASAPNATYFAYGDDGLTLALFTMSHNVARSHGTTGPSAIDSLVNSTVDESYGPIVIRATASGNTLTGRGDARFSVPESQRLRNVWVYANGSFSPRLLQGFGGEVNADATLVVTSNFHIIKRGSGEIMSIKPPLNLEIGEVLRLENSTGGPLKFTPGQIDSVNSALTLPDGHFVSLIWDGHGWAPGA